jgi:hypothetical protein
MLPERGGRITAALPSNHPEMRHGPSLARHQNGPHNQYLTATPYGALTLRPRPAVDMRILRRIFGQLMT